MVPPEKKNYKHFMKYMGSMITKVARKEVCVGM